MKGHSSLYVVVFSILFVLPAGYLCLDPPDCRIRDDDPCDGITSSGDSLANMLENLHEHLCGCVYVHGNIHIVISSSWPDLDAPLTESNFSFFYHIKEVYDYVYLQDIPEIERLSFPNLRLIRGESLITSKDAALVVFNSYIHNLYMPQLTEITKGNVRFQDKNNPSICNVLSVNWEDIIRINGSNFTTLSKCTDQYTPNCSSISCDYCWCNDTSDAQCCQDLTRDCSGCGNGRCHRPSGGGTPTCCSSVCAAGCDGGLADQCRACTLGHVLNGNLCETSCPPLKIIQGTAIVRNPDFKYEIQGLCVLPCPRGTFELDSIGQCVEECPPGMMSGESEFGGMRCMECDKEYCQECAGKNSNDIPENCTLILGSFAVSTDPSGYYKLSTIETIRGSLTMEKLSVNHFSYLSNLVVVGSDSNEVGTYPCNGGERDTYSIFISENDDLISIDFSSLKNIYGGGISMDRNPSLCIIGDLSLFVNDSTADICLEDNYRQLMENCTAQNYTCHPQCNTTDGCWVQNSDTHCVTCANYIYQGRCVASCEDSDELGELLFANETGQCVSCNKLCNGSCTGPAPTDCSRCRSLFVNLEGNNVFECVETCGEKQYEKVVTNETAGSKQCLMCSSRCEKGCIGPGFTLADCNNCSYASINESINGTTDLDQIICFEDQCPSGWFEDMTSDGIWFYGHFVSNPCQPCHESCLECNGPGPSNCTVCDGRVSLTNGMCFLPPEIGRNESNSLGETVGGAMAAVLVLILIAVAIVMLIILYKHQKLKKNSKNMFHGYDPEDLEMLTLEKETLQPPLVPPNAAKLIVTPEDTLEFGKELGAGAFGTVYEGYWKPDEENNYHVAIKVLKNTSPAANKELLQEGVVMGCMDHENVVRLYCVCMSKQLMLVSQFVPLGALLDYLKRRKDQLSAKSILQFASQIALGMAYLESKYLVHRDLAARNVLVQSHRKVKITDFGLTRILQSDQDHYKAESTKMPVRWLPPESIRHRVFTHKTDVWSFGVTVWEILTFGARPYQGKKPFEILKQIEGGRRLDQPMTCTIELYGILLECWLPEPESRPSFEDLHERLKEMAKDPCRYVLTVQDGNASDYGQLPSNEKRENETVYETPFAGNVSLDNSLPSNISVDPYSEQPNSAVAIPGAKGNSMKQPVGSYEVALQGAQEPDPRYVKVNIGQNQPFPELPSNDSVTNAGYDYLDEQKLLEQQQQDSNVKQPLYINKSNPSNSSKEDAIPRTSTISDHYETRKNNIGAVVEDFYDVEQSYEQPMDGKIGNPTLINQMYDSNVRPSGGVGPVMNNVPPTDNYEEPVDSELLKKEMKSNSLVNPVYDSNPDAIETHNYEQMDEDDEVEHAKPVMTGLDNATYDSTVTNGNQVPPIGEYEMIDEEDMNNDGGVHNATYDSSVGVGSSLPGNNGIHNLTYDSATTNGDQVPPISEYEVINESELPPPPTASGLHNPTYDSGPTAPNGLINATYESGPINPAPNGLINATYDSSPSAIANTSNSFHGNGVVNKMYDSRVEPVNSGGITNSMYDSTAVNSVPPTNDYEELDEDNSALIPEGDNYEEMGPGSLNVTTNGNGGGVVNMTYDSAPLRAPSMSDDRVASPYEIPVLHDDYELPHDGDPDLINVYDAPLS